MPGIHVLVLLDERSYGVKLSTREALYRGVRYCRIASPAPRPHGI